MLSTKIKITTTDVLGYILLFIIVVMEFRISIQQQWNVVYPASYESGYALNGTEYKTFTTASYASCLFECEKDISCMSLNFLMTTSTCDLNTHTKESSPNRFIGRHNSVYSINPAGRKSITKGKKGSPGKSCLDILVSGGSVGTGVYWIDPANTGNPIQAYCDMTTDGGGWTIVKRLVQPGSTKLTTDLSLDTYQVIKEYDRTDVNIIPKGAAMLDILQKMGFHQIHFYCHKKSSISVVSIMTKNNTVGQQVVRYFTDDASAAAQEFPKACDSFDRLPEDTSIISQFCTKWGGDPNGAKDINKWGGVGYHGPVRIAVRPFQIASTPTSAFACQNKYVLCDEEFSSTLPLQENDIWQISVR